MTGVRLGKLLVVKTSHSPRQSSETIDMDEAADEHSGMLDLAQTLNAQHASSISLMRMSTSLEPAVPAFGPASILVVVAQAPTMPGPFATSGGNAIPRSPARDGQRGRLPAPRPAGSGSHLGNTSVSHTASINHANVSEQRSEV